jgi:hypothetical protein
MISSVKAINVRKTEDRIKIKLSASRHAIYFHTRALLATRLSNKCRRHVTYDVTKSAQLPASAQRPLETNHVPVQPRSLSPSLLSLRSSSSSFCTFSLTVYSACPSDLY